MEAEVQHLLSVHQHQVLLQFFHQLHQLVVVEQEEMLQEILRVVHHIFKDYQVVQVVEVDVTTREVQEIHLL